jgi:DNA-binding transcriptional regulator GbsR (MarR family)
MTAPARQPDLAAVQDRFIATWGQMGSTWGISRTMAEAHALLFITGEPLCTDDVMERLAISRGNASMSLRALVDWGIVSRVHKRGDRKEYFQAEQDPWAIVQAIVRERLKREVMPVMTALFELRDECPAPGPEPVADVRRRIDEMLTLLQTVDSMGQRLGEVPHEQLASAAEALASAMSGGSAGLAPSNGGGRGRGNGGGGGGGTQAAGA